MKRLFKTLPKEKQIRLKEDLDNINELINKRYDEVKIFKFINEILLYHEENSFPDLSIEFLQKEIFPQPYSQRDLNVYKKNIKFLEELLN